MFRRKDAFVCGLPVLRPLRGGFAWRRSAIVVLCGLFFSGCVTTEYNAGSHSQDIMFNSTAKEVTMGQNLHKEIAHLMTISNNPADIERVNKTGSKIAEVCDRKEISYYFYVIEKDDEGRTDEKNAFSTPGGYVYIYKSLLDLLNDDELAFVLSHEVGHIVSRHAIKRLQAALGYNLIIIASAAVPNKDPYFTQGVSIALATILSGYSQEDEFNADELGAKYTKEIGFDPSAGMEVMEKLYKENKKEIRTYSYFRTHPYTASRIRHIKEALHLPLSVEDLVN